MTTLRECIQEDLKQIENESKLIPALQAKIANYRSEIQKCQGHLIHKHKIRRILAEIANLEEKIESMSSDKKREEFTRKTTPYLVKADESTILAELASAINPTARRRFVMGDGGTVVQRVRTNDASDQLMSDYREHIKREPPELRVHEDDECGESDCSGRMRIVGGIMSCKECGWSRQFIDTTGASMGYEDADRGYQAFYYQRRIHFREWLDQFQGKEKTQISNEIIRSVVEEFRTRGVVNLKDLTIHDVHGVLKDLNLRTLYKHKTQVWCLVTRNTPPQMTPEQENQCMIMFQNIQAPFEIHKPPERRNFLSYPYCLYKFVQLLGYNDLLTHIELLKGADKLEAQDKIFEKICGDLGWNFIPSH